jgi:hypothetical protein
MKLDEAAPNGESIRDVQRVWAELTVAEAIDLFERMAYWHKENAHGEWDFGGWHTHFTDSNGNELTIEVLHVLPDDETAPKKADETGPT